MKKNIAIEGFQIGDYVEVNDPGLLKLQELMRSFGENPRPNNIGYIEEFLDTNTALIIFPIDEECVSEHSQGAPYPITMLKKKTVKVMEENSLDLLSDEELIEKLAGAGYGPEKIAVYLGRPVKIFMKEWQNPDSPVHNHYNKGVLHTDASIGFKLAANAADGNITAAQQLSKIRWEQYVEDSKKQIYFSSELDEA